MSDQIRTIAVVDPRSLDGNPYEVAEQAVAQAEALVAVAIDSTEKALIMGRNAQDERELVIKGELSGELYDQTPQGKAFGRALEALGSARATLTSLAKAVSYNPKARVRVSK